MKINILHIAAVALLTTATACSITSKLEDDEVLYTGIKAIEINVPKGEKFPAEVEEQIEESVAILPNHSMLSSPYYTSPIKTGLWVYNHWDEDCTGFKHWLYDLLVADPVLISDVKPELRTSMISSLLDDNGYFGSTVSYELKYKGKDQKQAKILYTLDLPTPYTYSEISFFNPTTELEHAIDSLAHLEGHLRPGARYCTDSLSEVRINIANALRNKGYYYFRPEYIEYLADSTKEDRKIALKLNIVDDIPERATRIYYVGNVNATVKNYFGFGTPDTVEYRNCTVVKYNPIKLSRRLMPSCVAMRKGRLFTVKGLEITQENLSRLGIFSTVSIDVTPMDSLTCDTIDVNIECKLDLPIEAKVEIQGASKSNSYIGPSLVFGVSNKNLFGGGEQLSSELKLSYEWQTGKKTQSKLDSYEVGLGFTLAFPRLIAPRFIDRSRRYINWTKISTNFDLLNQPEYFNMFDFDIGLSWEWHSGRYSSHELSPLTLKFSHMFSYTDEFTALAFDNPSIENSFGDKFMPMITYSYTYNRSYGKNHKVNWNITLSESGNIVCSAASLLGSDNGTDSKTILGTPISQFVKATTELIYSYQLFPDNWLVTRAYLGVAHAYGNSSTVPFGEQFYVGGSNSLRGFAVRSVGPGSYHDGTEGNLSIYDHTGTFKLELNAEYRFPIFSYFKGALFVDAGNVWLLEEDDQRPGGKLSLSNLPEDLALNTGVGLRLDMDFLVVRADLGYGLHCPYENGHSGYFNLPLRDALSLHIAIGYPF